MVNIDPNILDAVAKASGNGASSSKASAKTSSLFSGSSALESNYDMFLQLLTTQLKNQNPLEPMDADKFTEQLTRFSQVEQQINGNKYLAELIGQSKVNANIGALGFLNTQVTAQGDSALLKDGHANWTIQSPSQSTLSAKVTIRNSANIIVRTEDITLKPGDQAYEWDGRDANGVAQPAGEYKIGIEAKDSSGSIVQVGTMVKGTVTGIDLSGGDPILLVGSRRLLINEISSIGVPGAAIN